MEDMAKKALIITLEYMQLIGETIEEEDIHSSKKLCDQFGEFLLSTAQSFRETAREIGSLEVDLAGKTYVTEIERATLNLAQVYLDQYVRWSQGQQRGVIPTEFPGFSELENIANDKD
jgi:hypothetical protein